MKREDKAPSAGNGADETTEPVTPDEPAPASTEERLAVLEEALREKAREAAESHDRWVREVAEGENFKKRIQRDKADAIRFANEALIRDLLPIVDNLEWALEHAAESGDSSIVEGVKLTLKMFRDVLGRHGVTEIDVTPGAPFDPALQEAVGMEAGTRPPNTVLRVQQRGYRLHERLLRAARVIVAGPAGESGRANH
jgi:molecular chaperone GrpE